MFDLADAHVLGWQKLLAAGCQHVFSLGNGTAYSVQLVTGISKAVTGGDDLTRVVSRREGDSPVLVAAAAYARRELGWKPRHPDLGYMISYEWKWH